MESDPKSHKDKIGTLFYFYTLIINFSFCENNRKRSILIPNENL